MATGDPNCREYQIQSLGNQYSTFNYVDCDGNKKVVFLDPYQSVFVCAIGYPTSTSNSTTRVDDVGACPTTTTTTTAPSAPKTSALKSCTYSIRNSSNVIVGVSYRNCTTNAGEFLNLQPGQATTICAESSGYYGSGINIVYDIPGVINGASAAQVSNYIVEIPVSGDCPTTTPVPAPSPSAVPKSCTYSIRNLSNVIVGVSYRNCTTNAGEFANLQPNQQITVCANSNGWYGPGINIVYDIPSGPKGVSASQVPEYVLEIPVSGDCPVETPVPVPTAKKICNYTINNFSNIQVGVSYRNCTTGLGEFKNLGAGQQISICAQYEGWYGPGINIVYDIPGVINGAAASQVSNYIIEIPVSGDCVTAPTPAVSPSRKITTPSPTPSKSGGLTSLPGRPLVDFCIKNNGSTILSYEIYDYTDGVTVKTVKATIPAGQELSVLSSLTPKITSGTGVVNSGKCDNKPVGPAQEYCIKNTGTVKLSYTSYEYDYVTDKLLEIRDYIDAGNSLTVLSQVKAPIITSGAGTVSSGACPDFRTIPLQEWCVKNTGTVALNYRIYDYTKETGKYIDQSLKPGEQVNVNSSIQPTISSGAGISTLGRCEIPVSPTPSRIPGLDDYCLTNVSSAVAKYEYYTYDSVSKTLKTNTGTLTSREQRTVYSQGKPKFISGTGDVAPYACFVPVTPRVSQSKVGGGFYPTPSPTRQIIATKPPIPTPSPIPGQLVVDIVVTCNDDPNRNNLPIPNLVTITGANNFKRSVTSGQVYTLPAGTYSILFDPYENTLFKYNPPTKIVITVGPGELKRALVYYTCTFQGKFYWLKPIVRKYENIPDKITKGIFSEKIKNFTSFYSSSISAPLVNYYTQVYHRHPYNSPTSSIQFTLSYGHYYGSGSNDEGGDVNDTPTRAVYSQYKALVSNQNDLTVSGSRFKLKVAGEKQTNSIYIINFQKERVDNEVDPSNIEINLAHLSGSEFINGVGSMATHTGSNVTVGGQNKVLRLISDFQGSVESMLTVTNGVLKFTDAGYVFNIVSGSIEDGIYNSSNPHYYGKLYPALRLILLDGDKLDQSASFGTVLSREVEGRNHQKMYISMKGAAELTDGSGDLLGMKGRAIELSNKNYYFIDVNNAEFNLSNNPTYVNGENANIVFNSELTNPFTYITTIGLYNDNRELLAVGKLTKPIFKNKLHEANFIVKV